MVMLEDSLGNAHYLIRLKVGIGNTHQLSFDTIMKTKLSLFKFVTLRELINRETTV